jgi:hypothetical protein
MKTKIGTPYFGAVVVLLVGAGLAGCDKPAPPAPPQAATKPSAPAPAAAPKAPAPPTAVAPAPVTDGAKLEKAGWTLLGQQQADRTRDTDRFVVGNAKGSFREIEVTVEGAPLNMESMVVTFGNGEQFKPGLRHSFNANSQSRAIDLPGEKRSIQHIDLAYRSDGTAKQDKATVKIYAR